MDINLFGRIADKLVESESITAEDKELYEYGLKQGLNMLLNIITTLVIGFIFGMVWQSILFMVSYIPLRSYAGGFHARTPLKCYIFSVILTMCVLLTVKYIPYNTILIGTLILVASIIICVFAPMGDENKPLDTLEIKVFKKRTRIVLLAEIAIACILLILGLMWIAVCIAVSIAVASLMLIMAAVKSKRNG